MAVLRAKPGSVEGKWGIAEVYRRLRKTDESKRLLNEVIEADNTFSPAKISLAFIKYLEMDFTASARLAYQVIQRGRKNVDLSNYVRAYGLYAGAKGMIAHYGGPLSKVINGTFVLSHLKKAEKLNPQAPSALYGLGSFYLLVPKFLGRDLDKAEDYLQRAIKIDPNFADVYVRLAQVYRIRGDRTKFDELLNRALVFDSQNELALDIKNEVCNFICVKEEN
jgi:tetratricopeptide (TPR) repeat protein